MLVTTLLHDDTVKYIYSDASKYIKENPTSRLYMEVYIPVNTEYTYEETDLDLPHILTIEEIEAQIELEKKQEEERKKKEEEERLKRLEEEEEARKLELSELIQSRVDISKLNLKIWLEKHPYSFTKADGTTDVYSVTEEKQQLLALELMTDQMLISAGQPCQPTWNAVNKPCENWDFNELQTLAVQIREYVKPRISTQQHTETELRGLSDYDEILAVPIGVEIYD